MVTDAAPRPPDATSGYVRMVAVVVTLFALSNLWMARHCLMPTAGEVRT